MNDLRRLLLLARPQWPAFGGLAALGLLVVATNVATGVLVARILTRILGGEAVGDVMPLIAAAVVVLALRTVLLWAQTGMGAAVGGAVKEAIRARLYRKLLALGPAWLTAARTGEVQAVLVDGVEMLQSVYNRLVTQTVVSLVAGLALGVFVVTLDPYVGAIVLASLLLVPVLPPLSERVLGHPARFWREHYFGMSAEYLDNLQGMTTLKTFGASERRGQELAVRANAVRDHATTLCNRQIGLSGIVHLLVATGSALSVGVGAIRVANGQLAPGDLLLILLLARECFRPVHELAFALHSAFWGLVVAEPIFALLDAKPSVADGAVRGGRRSARGAPPGIAFEAVTFSYGRRDRPALAGFELAIRPRETVALVGRSGGGKTTCVSLLLRFFDPEAGRITLGGVDLRDLPLDALRGQIAVVAQDTYLFHGTVRENLLLARPDASEAEVRAALGAAAAEDFVDRLPHGLDSIVGERGLKLSGGERQRLAIARALLKDAPVLILDEATSSVDMASEAAIQGALERLRAGRTTLIIAHRLSTVRSADRIVVLDQGRAIEQGRPEDLVVAGGEYARLVTAQGDGR